MHAIILCGGSGTRLWPLSRKNYPKQFLNLYSGKSLLQETFLRMREIIPGENIILVTNQDNFFNVFNQIKEVEKDFRKDRILVEPASLNTAPAITYAMKYLAEKRKIDSGSPAIILPSDHYIGNKKAYLDLVKKALAEAGDNIGTIGITPTKPETGYGYIRKGDKQNGHYKVLEFKEKPDENTARKYLESGEYVWNSGMYIFNIRTFIQELRSHSPKIYSLMTKDFDTFLKEFSRLPSISVDYALSEKSDKVIVFEGDFGWNDIGSFDSLAEIITRDANPRHLSFDSKNIFVHTESNRLVATLGVEDLNIVETADSILVQKQGRAEDVKKIVDYLKEKNMRELEHNLIVHRPWGKYEVLIDEPLLKVKKITVYPEAKLSLQAHNHRVEHWIVVKGTAKIVHGEKEVNLAENESTFIPRRTKHRLENPGKINLEIIEVQTGNYLEEDDIIRYEDAYNRS